MEIINFVFLWEYYEILVTGFSYESLWNYSEMCLSQLFLILW